MIFPLLFLQKNTIKGEGGVFLKRGQTMLPHTNSKRRVDKKQFLTQYEVLRRHSKLCIGFITLEKNLDSYGASLLTYKLHKSLSEQEVVNIFKCLLKYMKNFYGWNINESSDIKSPDVFQEVKVKIKINDEFFLPLLKGGFKISFVNKNHCILRHRYEDKTSLVYGEVEGWFKEEKDLFSILMQEHYQKIEECICRNEEVQSSDMGTLQHYSLRDKERWQYYLFLLRENPKIYLDYVRTMTILSITQ